MAETNLPLPTLFRHALEAVAKVMHMSTVEDEAQELVQATLKDLKESHLRIRELSLFSPNETLDDISTKDLVYLALPYVLGDAENRVRTTERPERMKVLMDAMAVYEAFVHQLEHYGIVPEDEKRLYSKRSLIFVDPTRRRETKVIQYKKSKEIKDRIETLQNRRIGPQPSSSSDSPTDFDLLASLLPSPSTFTSEVETDLDSSTDDILRETTLLLLRKLYAEAHTQLESMEQELQLLRNAPPSPTDTSPSDSDARGDRIKRKEDDQTWRLDIQTPMSGGHDGKGPLLDHQGRPLRPFTILPSNAAERARLQSQVFGPGYNLPTMSVDEYLEIERQRGNILTGGGPASMNKPTSSEQLAIDAEMEGTILGEEKAEEKRQKDEKWAQYKDTHPRGAGNIMNRG